MDQAIKIIITGPECTGKSTLANWLTKRFDATLVPEYARQYLEANGPDYTYDKVEYMARKQLELEKEAENAHPLIICDTDILTYLIWFQEVYHQVPPFISESWIMQKASHYLLMKPDIPWVKDPLRENPADRDRLYDLYQHELDNKKHPYTVIYGEGEKRKEVALNATEVLILR